MFLYIRNIHDDALLYYYPKIGPGYVGATWPSWCYTHHMHWKRHRAVYDTHTMKRLLCLEFKLSQGTCVLEKLLIMPRHFILQFPELPSARKWTAVPPNRTLKLKKKKKKQTKKEKRWLKTFWNVQCSVVTTSKQLPPSRCKIKCLTGFVLIRTNSRCASVLAESFDPVPF